MPERSVPDRDRLLAEAAHEKLMRYAAVATPADPSSTQSPSSPEQWELLHLLQQEMETLGLQEVHLSEHGVLTGLLPPDPPTAPTIALLAHVDTFPGVPTGPVRPMLHRGYTGERLVLPGGAALDPALDPTLARVVGHDLVTSDGSTLLGADDKAGVAEILTAVARLLTSSRRPRAGVRVVFTPDEEIGRGADHVDIPRLGAVAGYTLDGGELGQLQWENFHAENLRVVIEGRSSHTGNARGRMVNAVALASWLVNALSPADRPETTDGRQGFCHVDEIRGQVERVEMLLLLRDFTREGLERRRRALGLLLEAMQALFPGARASFETVGGYRNMAEVLRDHPIPVALAREAMHRCGIPVQEAPIRGGTDGARLTELGLPCPNLFTGAGGFHSRAEWASAAWMEQAVAVVVELVHLWGQQDTRRPDFAEGA